MFVSTNPLLQPHSCVFPTLTKSSELNNCKDLICSLSLGKTTACCGRGRHLFPGCRLQGGHLFQGSQRELATSRVGFLAQSAGLTGMTNNSSLNAASTSLA